MYHSRYLRALHLLRLGAVAASAFLLLPLAFAQVVSVSRNSLDESSFSIPPNPFGFAAPASALPEAPQPQPDSQPLPPKPRLGAVEIGWTTLYANEGGNERDEINGPFYRLSINIPKGFDVFFDSTNYYGLNSKGSLNGHGFTFGLGHGVFPTKHVKPNFFAESGVVRTSNAGSIVDQFAFASGLAFAIPINRHIDLALTPAEWVFLYPNGDPRNDYNAKVGISFPFGHR